MRAKLEPEDVHSSDKAGVPPFSSPARHLPVLLTNLPSDQIG